VAHEFKNPIICILEISEQLSEVFNQKNKQKKIIINRNLSLIRALSNYLLILIKDLDYFSESQIHDKITLNLTETNLEEIINFCQEIAKGILKKNKKDKNIKFYIKRDINLPMNIFTDEIKVKQILINLISNSIKFTNSGHITLKVQLNESNIKFAVIDTGIGIPNSVKDKLFKPFVAKRSGNENKLGTGLGLSIVYDLTTKIGKTIEYSSEQGKGTKFWFYIPLSTRSVNNKSISSFSREIEQSSNLNSFIKKSINSSVDTVIKEPTLYNIVINNSILQTNMIQLNIEKPLQRSSFNPSTMKKITQKNVIVADDEHLTRNSTIRILKMVANDHNINLNIIEAEDGLETLYYTYKSVSKGEKILIISDENMKYLSGQKTAKILRKFENNQVMNHIPFFLVTAYSKDFPVSKQCKIDGVFTKPLVKTSVEEILKSFNV
jgi:two-component sensor histidine kinase